MPTELNINVSGHAEQVPGAPGPGQTGYVYPGGYRAPPSTQGVPGGTGSGGPSHSWMPTGWNAPATGQGVAGAFRSQAQQLPGGGSTSGGGASSGVPPQRAGGVLDMGTRNPAPWDMASEARRLGSRRASGGLGLWRQAGRFAIGEVGADVLGRYGGYAASAVGARAGDMAAAGSFAARASIVGAAVVGAGVGLAQHGARRAEELAAYSGSLAAVDARVQMMRIRSDMESASMYGEGLGAVRESVAKLQIAGTQILDALVDLLAPLLSVIADTITLILQGLRFLIDFFKGKDKPAAGQTVNDLLDMIENFDIPGFGIVPEEQKRERNFIPARRDAAAALRGVNDPFNALVNLNAGR